MDGDSIKKEPEVILLHNPSGRLTPKTFQEHYAEPLTEPRLALAFATAFNQFWWIEDDIYDYKEGTPEYIKACEITDAWGEVMDMYMNKVLTILRDEGYTIPDKGVITVLEIFMERNGYENHGGWWIKKNV